MKLSVSIFIIAAIGTCLVHSKTQKSPVIDNITDMKELKKLFRTKTNVLILFVAGMKENNAVLASFREAAHTVKGQGTMVLLDCNNSEVKKICKKLKAAPAPFALKHFKDGDFHKDYDRQLSATSMVNFMRDPTGDLPWEEDPIGVDVLHVPDAVTLGKFLKKEVKPTLVMFYAPWCGFCKTLKPEFSAAATELKGRYVLAAIDVNRPENSIIRKQYNITGFPTLLYYENGRMKYTFEGENNKAGIVAFMKNPTAPPPAKQKEPDWASESSSEIVHLTVGNFEPALKDEKSVLVMFYAPWCGHCKKMKPEYEKAAEIMKAKNIPGVLAALDATKEAPIGHQYGVKGYPTVKYFSNGEFKFDVNVREADKIVKFMQNPTEPPPPPAPEAPWEDEPSEVVHLNEETFKPFLKKKKHVLVMFYAPWCGHCKRAKPEFARAADHFRDDPKTELAAVDCTRHSAVCSSYEVRGYPTIKYFSYLKTVQEYNGGRTETDFIAYLKDPTAAPSKTDKVAEPYGDFPGVDQMLVLTDANFDEVTKQQPNLLIMFYAPWCGHCKHMKPDFAMVAQLLADEKVAAKVAALDCTVHTKTAERFQIRGYPTLKFFTNGQFQKNYEGKRTAQDMLQFLRSGGALAKDEL
ncbi:LOW QUALITY PROTEIN: protein disulfide-isomerase A5 [Anopheles stephensi]|uniref:Thioredoxin domain-containing protein n=1 Tax=Anopheles stephensi TaxID=30069 RepID=A0A182YHC3_ANOST|nr:LOW QUALITY PROTEIN: protein disulfide-isomerase A5 [Anopheles stephensi]